MTCKIEVERSCQNCRGEYCIEHNEGCSSSMVWHPISPFPLTLLLSNSTDAYLV